jgi:hypothetical protein
MGSHIFLISSLSTEARSSVRYRNYNITDKQNDNNADKQNDNNAGLSYKELAILNLLLGGK